MERYGGRKGEEARNFSHITNVHFCSIINSQPQNVVKASLQIETDILQQKVMKVVIEIEEWIG